MQKSAKMKKKKNLVRVAQQHQWSPQKPLICVVYSVSWVYALSGAGDAANIGVSQEKQGILIFLWNALHNLLWKI